MKTVLPVWLGVILGSQGLWATDFTTQAAKLRRAADNHFYNLEYDAALEDYGKLIELNPADPVTYNSLASTYLYKELYRLGLLESALFGMENRFLTQERVEMEPSAKAAFLTALENARGAAETMHVAWPASAIPDYALCTSSALQATEYFMIEKAWFAALRSGKKAKNYCENARRKNPELLDPYLTLGVNEYVVGSLPLPVKILAAIGGAHGSKSKGIEYVENVAQRGERDRDNARILLAVLYRREKRPLDAAGLLRSLFAEYPHNYLFELELVQAYAEARDFPRAKETLHGFKQTAIAAGDPMRQSQANRLCERIERMETKGRDE
jgi:tetratricopeptide (TPR) repeat protein